MTTPTQPTWFDVLGVPPRFHLDGAELERRFHEQSRALHPDKHMKSDGATRIKAALATSQLNEAYRALRDPIRRAEYLLSLEGYKLTDDRSGHKVAPAFLMEMMDLREALAEAKGARDLDGVRSLAAQVKARHAEVLATLDDAFGRFESGDRSALPTAADALVAQRYFRRFLDEVDAIEDAPP